MSAIKSKQPASFHALQTVHMVFQPNKSAVKSGDRNLISDKLKSATQIYLDRFAIGLSLLCTVHCLAIPVVLILFPSLMATLHIDDHVFHALLLWLAIPSSAVAIFLGCKRHKDHLVFILAGIGLVSLTATAFFGHDVLGETGEKIATLFAVSILAYAHWRNYSLCRGDSCQH